MPGATLRFTTAIVILALATPAGVAQTDEERALEQLRAELVGIERTLSSQIARRDDGKAELRRIELALAETRAELSALSASIDEQSRRRAEIAAGQRAAGARLEAQQAALAEQARMSYQAGPQEFLKLLLSQESPADIGRMLSYYDYLNRYRSEQIALVTAERERLVELAAESAAVQAELERLEGAQRDRENELAADQAERTALLAGLDAAIAESGGRLEQMRAEEAELAELIARLAEIPAGYAVNSDDPFQAHRGNLPLPIEGQVVAGFGDERDSDGLMRWEAMLIEAPAGTTVRAPYHGQVLFANWSSQMGLTLIIDHGDGYWSLYGHNGALLREEAEWVRAGDAIAEVGNTGGRATPALYFSIVKDQEPVDPAAWLR